MGGFEAKTLVLVEPSLGYHSWYVRFLTDTLESGYKTLLVGQFDWGGRLQKSNGGAQSLPQNDWKPFVECKGTR